MKLRIKKEFGVLELTRACIVVTYCAVTILEGVIVVTPKIFKTIKKIQKVTK